MSGFRAVRVHVAGRGVGTRIETFSTTVIVSDDALARGAHRREAIWRAKVWGLRRPLRIVHEQIGMAVSAPRTRHLRSRRWREAVGAEVDADLAQIGSPPDTDSAA